MKALMGPPENYAPIVSVTGKGIDVMIKIETNLDKEIACMAVNIADRRRYGKTNSK